MPPYVILQFSILLAVAGFVVYWKFETSARFERHRQAEEQTLKAMRGIQATMLTLKTEVEELREISRDLAARPMASNSVGMPGAKRSQALRMLRKGESAENVSAALKLPRSHVQMLEKVRTLAVAEPTPVPSATVDLTAILNSENRSVAPAAPQADSKTGPTIKRRVWATA
jgi:hypothetical protein